MILETLQQRLLQQMVKTVLAADRDRRDALLARTAQTPGLRETLSYILTLVDDATAVLREVFAPIEGIRLGVLHGALLHGRDLPNSGLDVLLFADEMAEDPLGPAIAEARRRLQRAISVECHRPRAPDGRTVLHQVLFGPHVVLVGTVAALPAPDRPERGARGRRHR